jgi:hypothetical protein
MKKHLVMLVAILAIVAITVPAFAVEFKYGGMYRLRWQSNDNLVDGKDRDSGTIFSGDRDDNQNYMDQRFRMYFSFVGSENLQVVTKWEVDTLWGNSFDKFTTGGGVGADSINLEMKNAYLDFNVPYTPVRSTLGVQGLTLLTGWMIDDDFSAAKFSAKFDPIRVTIGYIAAQNNDVTTTQENIDDVFISLDYAEGPWKASLVGLFQDGHNTDVSTFFNPRMSTGSITQGGGFTFLNPVFGLVNSAGIVTAVGGVPVANDNLLFDLGINLGYKIDWISAYINFVKNFGSFDVFPSLTDRSIDYTGYMVEGRGDVFYGPFTFSLGGFLASGDQFNPANDDEDGNFRYPRGASHYWSEIMGLGSLDQSVGGSYLNPVRATPANTKTGDQLNNQAKLRPGDRGYQAADVPSNLWMVNAGFAYQALEKTKLTFNYYYIGTQEDVLSGFHRSGGVIDGLRFDNSVGHELDFYIDQGVVDGLNLRIVGAYLIANEGFTINNGDDDAWEAGMVLQWHF